MKKNPPIELYSSEKFRTTFFQPEDLPQLFEAPFAHSFFVAKLESLLQYIQLPIPPIREKNHSLIWLTAGRLELNVASEPVHLQAGQLLVLPAYSVYAMHHVAQPPTGLVCHFDLSGIPQKFIHLFTQPEFSFLHENNIAQLVTFDPLQTGIAGLFARLLSESGRERVNEDLLTIYLLALLYEIKQALLQADAGQSADQRITHQFKALLKQYGRTHHPVHYYADLLAITANHLNKTIKRTTGRSPLNWLTNTLVLEARVLLFQSELSVQAIAWQLGFADQSYFSRLFKKTTNLAPLDYRRKHKLS